MTVRQPRYNKEEHARRGRDIYDRKVRPQVEAGNSGRIVTIELTAAISKWGTIRFPLPSLCWLDLPTHRSGAFESVKAPLTAYAGTVLRGGQRHLVEIDAADTQPLVDMALLRDRDQYMRIVENGAVTIEPV